MKKYAILIFYDFFKRENANYYPKCLYILNWSQFQFLKVLSATNIHDKTLTVTQ